MNSLVLISIVGGLVYWRGFAALVRYLQAREPRWVTDESDMPSMRVLP